MTITIGHDSGPPKRIKYPKRRWNLGMDCDSSILGKLRWLIVSNPDRYDLRLMFSHQTGKRDLFRQEKQYDREFEKEFGEPRRTVSYTKPRNTSATWDLNPKTGAWEKAKEVSVWRQQALGVGPKQTFGDVLATVFVLALFGIGIFFAFNPVLALLLLLVISVLSALSGAFFFVIF